LGRAEERLRGTLPAGGVLGKTAILLSREAKNN